MEEKEIEQELTNGNCIVCVQRVTYQ